MATLSADGTYVKVVKGDTLWDIASEHLGAGIKYKQLAAINSISNPDYICVGQTIYLTSGAGSSTSSASTSSNKATITQFGELSSAENTLLATWDWSRESDHTASYKVAWTYDYGDGIWLGSTSSISVDEDYPALSRISTFSIPDGALRVKFKVLPISETKDDENNTSYWTAEWSTEKTWTNDTPLETPSVPSVELTARWQITASLTNIEIANATHIHFQLFRDNKAFITKTVEIVASDASAVFAINTGYKYKVRCRAQNSKNSTYSEWSQFTDSLDGPPATPQITTLKAVEKTSVQIAWTDAGTATSYTIEYTTTKDYFDNAVTSGISSVSVEEGVTSTWIIELDSGEEYFFRIKAINETSESQWSEIKSIAIGEPPAAPTTWSSTTTGMVGEPINLYWLHNSKDNSNQTFAQLELYDSESEATVTYTFEDVTMDNEVLSYIPLTEDEKDEGKINTCTLKNTLYPEGATLKWRVRTAGITEEFSDWSIQRTIDIYAPPTLELSAVDAGGNMIETLTSFPFYVKALAGPNTQAPISYHLSVKSNSIYETVDNIGNSIMVNKNEEIYSKYFDVNEDLLVKFSADNINLENNIEYTITCTVYMNSGLTVDESVAFVVGWEDKYYTPNAAIGIDKTTMTANIRPYCEECIPVNYLVELNSGIYTKTSTELSSVWRDPRSYRVGRTTTGESVFSGVTGDGEEVYYCSVLNYVYKYDVQLSVYRREFDGSFTELATGIDATKATTIIDPHPALDYARYRIVATSKKTGAVSYYDLPGYPVGGNAVIIQWDEDWSSFETSDDETPEQPSYSGSMLAIPYNIDVSESNSSDVSTIEYAGRQHPVTYYGTHLGVSASWKVEIPKTDKETIYALRRLARWMGDVYVREPSGSGYWATISVSFSQNHCETTIPVSLNITQVEGGV